MHSYFYAILAAMASTSAKPTVISWRSFIILSIVVLACVAIIPQVHQLESGFQQLIHAKPLFVGLAILSICMAVTASGGTYTYLALKKIRLWHSVLVQTAGMFVNRLLPAGIGGIGLNARFLYTHKHTAAQATTVAVMNNILTGIGHTVLLVVAVVAAREDFPEMRLTEAQIYISVAAIVTIIVIIGFGQYSALTKRVHAFMHAMAKTIAAYKRRKEQMVWAISCALINTSGHTFALYWLTLAFDVHLSLAIVIIILTGGVVAASVTPTPGGVLGAEAALAAGLIGFGVDSPDAIAIAVSYRIVSYWLPLVPGVIALLYIQKRRLI